MASKKGIALTAGIAAAIFGSSFLIWYIPRSSPGSLLGQPRADNEVIGDVFARHNDLATNIELKFDQWKNDDLANESMTAQLVSAKSQVEEMRQELANRQPAQEWKKSYDIYLQALDSYTAYLDALKAKVDGGDRTDPDPALKQKWQQRVNQSVDAVPI
ncbi:MAG TPA: hypothetical protein VGJ42_02725 [Nitrososphaera sp.]